MALLQISEPGQTPAPHQRKYAAGIDLGTTNSLVATVRNGQAETIADADGHHLLPSVVRYCSQSGITVGRAAKDAAVEDPYNTIASVKRLMGRGLADIQDIVSHCPYRIENSEQGMPAICTSLGNKSPVQVSSDILNVLAKRAEEALAAPLDGVVITVPAYFDDAQRQATKDAARLVGLNVLRLLNEPTAAAVAYGLDSGKDGIHAVYDLGGGTFDISVLNLNKGVFEVLATGGDSALGGDDMDRVIADWIFKQALIMTDVSASTTREVLKQARQAKEALSDALETEVVLNVGEQTIWRGTLSREMFEAMIEPIVSKSLKACRRTLKDSGIQASAIEDIVMVGGATRVPYVRQKVAEFFGKPPLVSIDPDRVVAIGAAIQADILVGNKPDSELVLLDVIPLSLGVETMGGLVEKIIPRNTPIPVRRAQDFTTYQDGQTAMAVHVLQGERELVSDCRSLARFELRGIPPMVAGAAKIRISYQVDADGLLAVSAEELTSGVVAQIQVKPSYGLTEAQIQQMLKASLENAEADVLARNLLEQRVEAERTTLAVDAALEQDGHLLPAIERKAIDDAIAALKLSQQGDDAVAIQKAIEHLNKVSTQFAAIRMNANIQSALKGHSVDEIG